MALRRPRRRRRPNARVLRADGRLINLADQQEKERARRRGGDICAKQNEAWHYFDSVGEICMAHEFMGQAQRKVRLVAAVTADPSQPPVPITDETSPAEVGVPAETLAAATALVDGMKSEDGTHGRIMHGLGVNLGVAGEANLTYNRGGWDVYSTDQLGADSQGRWVIRDNPGDRTGTPLDPDAAVARIWRRHPRWVDQPHTPMFAVLELCEELQLLNKMIRSAVRSRISQGGILGIAEEFSFAAADTQKQNVGGQNVDPFIADLMKAGMEPIADEGSPSAVMPLIVQARKDLIRDGINYIELTRRVDPEMARQRDELIRRIASGLDLPAEILLGLAQANHWNAWLIDEQSFKAHIEPMSLLICAGVTSGLLRPTMAGMPGAERVVVWYDPTLLLGHPDRAENAVRAYDREAIGPQALRRSLGFADEDAPTGDEVVEMRARVQARRGSQPGGDPNETPPGPAGDGDMPEGRDAAVATLVSAGAIRVGSRLGELDRALFERLQTAADRAISRQVEKIGAKLRSKVQGDSAAKARLAGVDNASVAARMGSAAVEEIFDGQALADGLADGLAEDWDRWVTRTQQEAARLAARYGPVDTAALEATQRENRRAGWLSFTASLAAVLTDRLFDPAPQAPDVGEFDDTLAVPPGAVRQALSKAGGAVGTLQVGGAILDLAGVPAGLVATGRLSLATFRSVGLAVEGWEWETGAPSQPFEPHANLEGERFVTFTDDVLASDGGYPYVSHYFPGDHDGCQCSVTPTLIEMQEAA